jgi:hypothetical protein
MRRNSFIASANWGSRVSFFLYIDSPNLGRTGSGFTKNLGQSTQTQDAFVELRPTGTPKIAIDAGLLLVPACRDCLTSAASVLPIDFGAYSFLASGPTASSLGRDSGVQIKGNIARGCLEYRLGMFQGFKNSYNAELDAAPTQIGSNAPRFAARLQYNLLDAEAPTSFYSGVSFGQRHVVAVGASADRQGSYRTYAADLFVDHPVRGGSATLQIDAIHYDGGALLPGLPRQNVWLVEGGYYRRALRVAPWIKLEGRDFVAGAPGAGPAERRYQGGLSYYAMGNTINVKTGYGVNVFDRRGLPALHQRSFTTQLQAFVY